MCGVVGFCGPGVAPTEAEALLKRMSGAVAHRGPDETGCFVAPGVGFGHRRLSIIGLANGQQPMTSSDGQLAITFNGEIFNYIELRAELMARGHIFRTDSDTEVILQLYEVEGDACLERLNGDFAFALWDERRHRLLLARDRMGVRPLFYAWRGPTLYFASEIKALLEVPGIDAELDLKALDQIFTLWAPIAPRTAFRAIFELPPAHMMVVEQGRGASQPYWHLDFPDADAPAVSVSEAGVAEEVRALLDDATRIRLRADVPVGAYLSGGLDSSVISALAARMVSDRLRTFSVTFDSAEHDESSFQQEMVRALGTEHSSVACRPADIADLFPDVIRHAERPIIRTAPAPLHRLSRLARDEGFKVVLTGEGADEIFAGYDIFREARVRRFVARQPHSKFRPLLLRKLYPYMPGLKAQSAEYLAAFFATNDDMSDPLFSHRPRFRGTAMTKRFFSAELRQALGSYDAAAALVEQLPERFGRWHPLHQAQYLETTLLLPGYILSSQGDRMTMANGVEGRFPFLDHRLVEAAARIPTEMKLRGLSEKHILKRATRDLVPALIGTRNKQPYRAPDSASFRQADYVEDLLGPTSVSQAGLFNPQAVQTLAHKCRSQSVDGFRDNAAFVGILSTQLWNRQFTGQA